jgi:hypothetical protein
LKSLKHGQAKPVIDVKKEVKGRLKDCSNVIPVLEKIMPIEMLLST